MSDIAKRLRVSAKYNSFNGGFYERSIVKSQMEEAADYIEQLERDLIETRAALEVVVQQLRVELGEARVALFAHHMHLGGWSGPEYLLEKYQTELKAAREVM